ncbi:MAG: Uma2 family endonuclease [Clostridia bacterium]|nr:Uma2 family endonuclease [Deltaproteobacteria bacterium]
MSTIVRRHAYAYADYLRMDDATRDLKLEYIAGDVYAMAGGSVRHSTVSVNMTRHLANQLDGKLCQVGNSDLRLRVLTTGLATYPDVSVVCGTLQLDPEDPSGHTITNPVVLVEVSSPSTKDFDRGEKADHYRTIPSLRELLLVAHDARLIEVWRRHGDDWTLDVVRDTGQVELQSIACRLRLDDIYKDPLG